MRFTIMYSPIPLPTTIFFKYGYEIYLSIKLLQPHKRQHRYLLDIFCGYLFIEVGMLMLVLLARLCGGKGFRYLILVSYRFIK